MALQSVLVRPSVDALVVGALVLIVLVLVARGVTQQSPGIALSAMPLAALAVGLMISASLTKAK